MKKIKLMFQNKTYSRLLFASFASEIGNEIGATAFLFYLLKEFSTKPYLATLTELMNSLPILLVFLFIGVIADKMDRQKVANYSDFISAGLSLLLIVAVCMHSIPLMFAILFTRKMFQSFFAPAESGIIQGILSKEEYILSAGINSVVQSIFTLFGRGLGAIAFWLVGIYGAILIDALSFFISFLFIRSCKIPKEVRLPNGKHSLKDIGIKAIFSDFVEGLKYIHHHTFLKIIVSGYFFFGIINASYALMPIFLLKYKLAPHSYEQMAIWEGIIIGGGLLVGSFVFSAISDKLHPTKMIMGGLIFSGIFTVCIGFSTNLVIFFFFLFLVAFFLPAINMGTGGLLPSIVDSTFMGRVKGCIQPLSMISGSLTLVVLSICFPHMISIESIFWGIGCTMTGLGLIYIYLLPKYQPKNN